MSLSFSGNPSSSSDTQEIVPYDIQKDRTRLTAELVGTQKVDDLVSTIEVYQLETIVDFGNEVASEIAKCSDAILKGMNLQQLDDSGTMLQSLAKIMDQFDLKEIEEKPGLLNKMFSNVRKNLDKVLAKYHTMGEDVDRIYVQLKQYEAEIKESNRKLESMFQTNVTYYHELVRYILAGEQGCQEIQNYLEQRRADLASTGDSSIQFDITALEQAHMMLEQRVHDLRIAENVAMQSIPMLKTMEFSNMNLVRKINSAFIITLPVFKQALAQAILLKRQRIQTEAMAALDAKTNEMLLKNAQNVANQVKATVEMTSNSSIKIETLEQSWKTIVQGIQDTRHIQEEAQKTRATDAQKLQQMKREFEEMMGGHARSEGV